MNDQKEGKWLPYSEDGSVHDRKKQKNGNNDLSVEVLLKRVESIGITMDLNKLRNVK
jgi:hypothetical protein